MKNSYFVLSFFSISDISVENVKDIEMYDSPFAKNKV